MRGIDWTGQGCIEELGAGEGRREGRQSSHVSVALHRIGDAWNAYAHIPRFRELTFRRLIRFDARETEASLVERRPPARLRRRQRAGKKGWMSDAGVSKDGRSQPGGVLGSRRRTRVDWRTRRQGVAEHSPRSPGAGAGAKAPTKPDFRCPVRLSFSAPDKLLGSPGVRPSILRL